MMTFYRTIGLFILLVMLQLSLSGQGPGQGQRFQEERIEQRRQAIKARRVAHITDQLSLTPAEARQFWPVYNEYLEKYEELSQKHRRWQYQFQSIERLSESEAAELAEREVRRLEESAVLKRTYHEKLKEVLPLKKIAMLYEAERSFNNMLLRESQHRMRGRQ